MQTRDIRRQFLQYFKDHQHAIIASSPVIPHDDPTLLFNNAGMNQFKDVFLGKSVRDYKRATTSQKCIRAGGKHNDLENVGHTTRHLTLFEMLGNFSFGDYFKAEAIRFAWEVSTQIFGFAPDRIWPTVFRDDDEAFELWTRYVPAKKITRFGEKDNFWAMGDTGPCGPCSELLYDRGSKYGNSQTPTEDTSGERFLEFWNLVFMQYNRTADGTMELLPNPSIDTGAGLERVVSLQMGVDSVFETDILRSLIAQVEQISGISYSNHDRAPAFRVIADHLRCLAFAIADGIQPSNVDRGYVLRKILRRAVRYGRTLGLEDPFLAKVLPRLIDTMGSDYPELIKGQNRIAEILTLEEEAFLRTLRRGGNILAQVIEHAQTHDKKLSGDDAFKLKDTYGLPFEEILLIAKDADLTIDQERYQLLEKEAKERSRNVQKSVHQVAEENIFVNYAKTHGPVHFLGYSEYLASGKISALLVEGKLVQEMHQGEKGMVVLDQTPFYAEMGGQIGDSGILTGTDQQFNVEDCQGPYTGVIAHIGTLEKGSLRVGDTLTAAVDQKRRQKIANNHTATHLLHWALHHVLGEHIKQAGSVVDSHRLRFDFSHHKALSAEELRQIEDLVNAKIRENKPVKWYEMPYEKAQSQQDIKQFFGEKYGSQVRVIDIDNVSRELCGGTHVTDLGNIGLFRIVKESSIAAGVRRIEAVTAEEAEALSRQNEDTLHALATLLKVQPMKLGERIGKLLEENTHLQQEVKAAKRELISQNIAHLLKQIEIINQIPVLLVKVAVSAEDLRFYADEIAAQLPSGILVLATAVQDRCHILIKVSEDLVHKGIKAQSLIQSIAPVIEGSGGGKANQAQAGGKAPHKIEEAFEVVRKSL